MKEEWKRQVKSPLFWGFLVGSLIANIWILLNFSGQRELVQKSRQAVEELGPSISAKTLDNYLSVLASAEVKESGIPTHRQMLEGGLKLSETLGSNDCYKAFADSMMLSGGAAKYAEKEYQKLEPVLIKNRESGVSNAFFVPCSQSFFNLFSRWIPLVCTLESILAAILIMMRCVTEPFSTQTAMIVYSTKTGRHIRRRQLSAGILLSLTFTLIIWAVTLVGAGILFPLGELWNAPLGSMMVLDSFYPIISWISLSVKEYIGLEFVLSAGISLLFSCLAFCFAAKSKNSFLAFVRLGFACALLYTVTSLFPRNSIVYFILQYNPVDFARNAGHWLVNGAAFFSPRYYEITVLSLWGLLAVLGAAIVHRQFIKKDL